MNSTGFKKVVAYIFLDGRIVRADDDMLSALKPGELKANGVFETMRYHHGAIFLLDKHLGRLTQGLKTLDIPAPYSRKEIKDAIAVVLKINRLQDARVRVMIWREKSLGRICISALAYRPYPADKYRRGFNVVISKKRISQPAKGPVPKAIAYRPFYQAYQEAVSQGFDDALIINQAGEIVEASRANIFLVKAGVLFTPDLKCGCLKGITRQVVFSLAKDKGIRSRQARIKPAEMCAMDEIFMTNSLFGIMPVTAINGRKVKQGLAGPVTRTLMAAYRALDLAGQRMRI